MRRRSMRSSSGLIFGGIYAARRFIQQGLTVLGLESAAGVGGVWFHNRYPGARADVESYDSCYYFSLEIYPEAEWTERFASQPEILAYLNFVADKLDVRRHFRFKTALTGAPWHPEGRHYSLTTRTGRSSDGFLARSPFLRFRNKGPINAYVRHSTIVPTCEAEEAWPQTVANAAAPLPRRHVNNYLVHVGPGGQRQFIPFADGFGVYVDSLQPGGRETAMYDSPSTSSQAAFVGIR